MSRTKALSNSLKWNPILNRAFQLRSGRKSWHIVKDILRSCGGVVTSDRKYGPVYTICGQIDPVQISTLKSILYTEMTFDGYEYSIVTYSTGRISVSITLADVHSEINTFNPEFFPAV